MTLSACCWIGRNVCHRHRDNGSVAPEAEWSEDPASRVFLRRGLQSNGLGSDRRRYRALSSRVCGPENDRGGRGVGIPGRLPARCAASLLIEVDGFDVALEETADSIRSICESNGSYDIRVAEDEEQRARLWLGRKSAFGAMGRISPDMIVMDAVIPRTRASRGPDSDPGYFRKLRPARGERVPRRRTGTCTR